MTKNAKKMTAKRKEQVRSKCGEAHHTTSSIMKVSKTRSPHDETRRRRHYLLLLTFVVIAVTLGGLLLTSSTASTYDSYSHATTASRTGSSLLAMEQLVQGGRTATTSAAAAAAGTATLVEASRRRTKQQQQQDQQRLSLPVPKTKARPCARPPLSDLRDQKLLQSQSREDEHLLQYFNGLCGGTYLEMGALDGVTFSNSYVFHKSALNWTGLLIELAPRNFARLKKNRPHDITVHAAVCSPRRMVHYYQHPHKSLKALSGVYEFASESFRTTFWTDLDPTDTSFQGTKEIECIPLQDIIQEHMIAPAKKQKANTATDNSNGNEDEDSVLLQPPSLLIDFFSLDVEGGELAVLQSIDYDHVAFGILLVEADEHNFIKNMALRTFVERQGYTFLGEYERSYWFVHRHFDEMYRNVLHADGGGTTATAAAAAAVTATVQ
jgi:Methyltransferase FkbM domain